METVTVLNDLIPFPLPQQETGPSLDPRFIGQRGPTFIVDGMQPVPRHPPEGLQNEIQVPVHPEGVHLHHRRTVVIVHDQARHTVTFCIDPAEHIGERIRYQTQ